jgi:hypothetical protein
MITKTARNTLKIGEMEVETVGAKALISQTEKQVAKGMKKGISYVIPSLKSALGEAIESNTWSWPRDTLRQNGTIAGSKRDIVDTGALKASLTLIPGYSTNYAVLKIRYSAPYAVITHEGGAIRPYGNNNASTVLIPGRPWIVATLKGSYGIEKYNPKDDFARGIRENLGKGQMQLVF